MPLKKNRKPYSQHQVFTFCGYNIWGRAAKAKSIQKAFTDSQNRIHTWSQIMRVNEYMSEAFCFSYLEYFGTVVKFQVPNPNSLNTRTSSQNVSKDRFHNSLAFLVIVSEGVEFTMAEMKQIISDCAACAHNKCGFPTEALVNPPPGIFNTRIVFLKSSFCLCPPTLSCVLTF